MELNLPIWTNTPETPIIAEDLNAIVEAIKLSFEEINKINDNRSDVGDIICSSTLDTMEKVIERYGGIKWERIKGKFILGADDEKYLVGDTGGEPEVTLTVDEMPEHMHMMNGGNTVSSINAVGWALSSNNLTSTVYGTNKTGGSQAHNNMPPYIAEYIWHRVE